MVLFLKQRVERFISWDGLNGVHERYEVLLKFLIIKWEIKLRRKFRYEIKFALDVADTVVVMDEGVIVEQGALLSSHEVPKLLLNTV